MRLMQRHCSPSPTLQGCCPFKLLLLLLLLLLRNTHRHTDGAAPRARFSIPKEKVTRGGGMWKRLKDDERNTRT